jgi:hypothetical protein
MRKKNKHKMPRSIWLKTKKNQMLEIYYVVEFMWIEIYHIDPKTTFHIIYSVWPVSD